MKKFNLLILLITVVLLFNQLHAQSQHLIDSLKEVIATSKDDTNKVLLIKKLATQYMNVNPEPMKQYAQQGLDLSEKLNYDRGRFICLNMFAIYYTLTSDYPAALTYANRALSIADKQRNVSQQFSANNTIGSIYDAMGEARLATPYRLKTLELAVALRDTNLISGAYGNLGINYVSLGNYTEALKYYFKGLEIREARKDSIGITRNYTQIGEVYHDQHDNANAKKYYSMAVIIGEKVGDKRDLISAYFYLGDIALDENRIEDSRANYNKSLALAKENGDQLFISGGYLGLGKVSMAENNLPQALEYFEKSLDIAKEIGDQQIIADAVESLGDAYTLQKNYSMALKFYEEEMKVARTVGFRLGLRSAYKKVAKTYAELHDYKNAYDYSLLTAQLSDSLFNDETAQKTTEMEAKYNSDKKEKEIALLTKDQEIKSLEIRKQTILKNSFIIGLALTVILFFFIYYFYQARQVLKLQSIRNKIAGDLHDDIGSTLNSISIYSEVVKNKVPQEIPELKLIGESARKVIDAMSDIVWTINTENDSFEKIVFRMRSLTHELMKAKKIEYSFKVSDNLSGLKLSMLTRRNFYLIFKEAVNNIVKYSNATRVSILLTSNQNMIELLIRDNGVGFDVNNAPRGNGLLNMKRRATEMKAEYKIESKQGEGTLIQLTRLKNLAS